MTIIPTSKIDVIMSCVPDTYLFRGKVKSFTSKQTEAISYMLYLISKGWGVTTASNRAGYKHEVSVQLLRRTLKRIPHNVIKLLSSSVY